MAALHLIDVLYNAGEINDIMNYGVIDGIGISVGVVRESSSKGFSPLVYKLGVEVVK